MEVFGELEKSLPRVFPGCGAAIPAVRQGASSHSTFMPHRHAQNIIFDWSGTLVDDLPPVLEATNAVMTAFGRPALTREEFRRQFRLPFMHWYEEVLPGVPLQALNDVFLPAFAASAQPVTVLPHAQRFLASCAAAGRRLFVLSSAPQHAVEQQAASLGLLSYFERIWAGVLDKREQIAALLRTHDLVPAETLMIGDMRHDIHTARAGGIHAVAVLTGYEFPEVIATAEPDLMVSDLDELHALHFPDAPAAVVQEPLQNLNI
jgi:phosphoglycolate phosphatase